MRRWVVQTEKVTKSLIEYVFLFILQIHSPHYAADTVSNVIIGRRNRDTADCRVAINKVRMAPISV